MKLPEGFRLAAFDDIDSTNTEAARRAASGEAGGLVVWAKSQGAGRGRRGRSWISLPGNLYVSLLLRPHAPPRAALALGFAAALAVAEAIQTTAPGAIVGLKWPNDVLLGGKKIAGCLLESRLSPDGKLEWLVIGTGVNVAHHPEGTEFPATHLAQAESTVCIESVLEAYLASFARWQERWENQGFEPIRQAWLGLAVGLGQPIKVRLENETLDGRFAALDAHGGLELAMDDGSVRVITAGDVFPGRT